MLYHLSLHSPAETDDKAMEAYKSKMRKVHIRLCLSRADSWFHVRRSEGVKTSLNPTRETKQERSQGGGCAALEVAFQTKSLGPIHTPLKKRKDSAVDSGPMVVDFTQTVEEAVVETSLNFRSKDAIWPIP